MGSEMASPSEFVSDPTPRSLCPLCGATGHLLYAGLRDRYFDAPGVWSMRRCTDKECGLVWTDPLVDRKAVGSFYARYYTHEEVADGPDILRLMHHKLVAFRVNLRANKTSRALVLLAHFLGLAHPAGSAEMDHAVLHLPPPVHRGQRLLDVGSGSGKHIRYLEQLGLMVEAIEPDVQAAISAQTRGVKITVGDFMTHDFGRSRFDFITMSHVIEHLHDPISAVRKARHLLLPGARLVVITPNVRSRGHKRFGRHWSMLDAPRHLTLFDAQTMGIIARRGGLEVEMLETTVCYAREVFVLSRRLMKEQEHKPSLRLGVRESLSGVPYQLAERIQLNGDGEELILVARRPT